MRRLVAGAALVAAAISDDGGGSVTRTVQIEMRDIAYSPASVSVERGETLRFVFTNTGKVAHDAFIGDEAAQADHEAEARASDAGHGGHGGDGVTVEPGETAEIEYGA